MIQNDGIVRRTDLNLRCYYVGLETEIYQIKPHHHVIHCKNVRSDFEELREYFDHSIRPLGFRIELVQKAPKTYSTKLKQISFFDVVDDFKGSYLTHFEVETAIIDRFPDVDISGIHVVEGAGFSITVRVSPDTPTEKMAQMEKALTEIELGTDQIEVCPETDAPDGKPAARRPNDVLLLRADRELPFTLEEADFWFENAPAIYRGDLKRERIPKYFSGSSACFLDCFASNCTDLRSILLLYETVYLALPLEDDFEAFLAKQNLTRSDLLQLIEMGKVVLVLDNLESRYDTQFLIATYQCSPLSVIGRRGVNTIVASFLAETRDRFTVRFPAAMEAAAEVYARAKRENDPQMAALAHLLSWPVIGVASSFNRLNLQGPLGIGMMGFEQLLPSPSDALGKKALENAQLFLHYAGHSVFMASALNATLFSAPIKEDAVADRQFRTASGIMADLLQVYWYNADAIASISKTRRQTFEEQHAINLFDCRRNISATKVAEIADRYHTPDGFKRILTDLERMTPMERNRRITQYNDVLADLAAASPSGGKLDFFLSASSFLSLPQILSLIISMFSAVREFAGRLGPLQKAAEHKQIEAHIRAAGLTENHQFVEDVYILDKISRVANLR